MNEFEIVPAAPADIPVLAEYRFAMFSEMYPEKDLSGVREEFIKAAVGYYREKLGTDGEVSLVAKCGGETIASGTIMFQLRPPGVNRLRNLFGYILNMYVRPEWRRKGAATAVMQALHDEARKRGAVRVGLHASSAGAAVYAGLGYVNKESYMETDLKPAVDNAAPG
ncbi:MAG: GNAT family N-acetyltransferase [Spirochaetales bacterium]|nr:GNAT family N-acetyltransferase [Spirochaetales bacterium]